MRSLSRQQAARLLNRSVKPQARQNSTSSATPNSSSSPTPQLRAAMLIHRAPLLTPQPTPFESAYYQYASSVQLALANPVPTEFYFKKGSLNERRFQKLQWLKEKATFGERIAGKEVDVGELPVEEDFKLNERSQEEEEEFLTASDLESSGSGSGSASSESEASSSSPSAPAHKIHRRGSSHLYLLTKSPSSNTWSLPTVSITNSKASTNTGGEGSSSAAMSDGLPLHDAATKYVRDTFGEDMDLWLVTRKPIGLIQEGDSNTFIFKSHILAGAPVSQSSTSPSHAWLTKSEIKALLSPNSSSDPLARTEEEIELEERLLQYRKEGIVIDESAGMWGQLEGLLNE